MLTVKHITAEGESTFGVERVRFDKPTDTTPATVWADRMPITGGRVFVMNDKGSTVAKYELDEAPR
ncbi:hypothetical protein OIU35_31630 [Boseaceae bacterium BT-24-1]|nr:hypothetical protein [Boseaceae bacterium BT-24-1]